MALRKSMRSLRIDQKPDLRALDEANMTADMADEMYKLLAIAKYDDRFVIPTTKRADSENMYNDRGILGFPTKS